MDWRLTYIGDGVRTNAAGSFSKHTTAYVSEEFAKATYQSDPLAWEVHDPQGKKHDLITAPTFVEPVTVPAEPEKKKRNPHSWEKKADES